MPEFNSSAYANHPINIPPEFPRILKQYTKAAIRTQPKDLLLWSVSYFRCLSKGEIPPVKERLEYPIPATDSGLTPGLLRVLNKQLGREDTVHKSDLRQKWRGICLSMESLDAILEEGKLTSDKLNWDDFVVEAAYHIAATPGVEAGMEVVCEAMSDQPDGYSSTLKSAVFIRMFRLMAARHGVGESTVEEAAEFLEKAARRQLDALMTQNLRSHECPSLE